MVSGLFIFEHGEPEPFRLKVRYCLLARGRVTAVRDNTRSGSYEDRPEPGFTLRGFLRAHGVPNAVLAIEDCEAVSIIALDALTRVSIEIRF